MGVLTVTLNPAIDETIGIDRLVPGQVHRARSVRYNAGGKGVDVASCLADWGVPVTAAGLLGAKNDAIFEQLFKAKGIRDAFVRLEQENRVNVTLVDDEGTTDIYLAGLSAVPEDLANLEKTLLQTARETSPDVAVLSGSLPAGCPPDVYAAMTEKLTHAGPKVLLDTSGPALKAVLDSATPPFGIKPNRNELAEVVGRPLKDIQSLSAEARALIERGMGLVVISLGGDGALFVSAQGALTAIKKMELHNSTVGAGDAMVAGIAAALEAGADLERIARLSTAFAVGKLALFGPNLPDKKTVESIAAEVEIASA